MSKVTRKSFKRKKIILGVSLFGGIGLVSTGFAAWVLSASTEQKATTNFSVGVVSDKNMSFSTPIIYKTGDTNKVADATFHFEPLATDNQGRVRYDGSNPESLSLTVEGTLSQVQNLGDITGILSSSDNESLNAAISKGYVVAPEAYKASAITLYDNKVTPATHSEKFEATITGEDDKTMSYTYVVEFKWGTAFKGMNPSVYFDEDADGKEIPQGSKDSTAEENSVAGILTDLHDLLDGITFELTLTANPN